VEAYKCLSFKEPTECIIAAADFCKSIVDGVQFTDKSEAEKRTRLRSDLRVVDMPREGSIFLGFESAASWRK
jgi:hypothetical protein